MAKRTAAMRSTQARQKTVTPVSKGAGASTQQRGRAPLPFNIGMPKGVNPDDEEGLYSNPADVVGKRVGRRAESVAAASARMRGFTDEADVDMDALGEADLPANSLQEPEEDDSEQEPTDIDVEQVVPQLQRASDAEFKAMLRDVVEAEVQRRLTEERKQLPQPIAETAAEAVGRTAAHFLTGMSTVPVQAAPIPQPVPQQYLTSRVIEEADIDRLWDWLRADTDGSNGFFGFMPKTSRHLRGIIDALVQGESNGVGMIRSLVIEQALGDKIQASTHFGFAMVAPMFSEDRLALLHIFLEPRHRGQLPNMLGGLFDLAAKELPGYKLAVLPSSDAQRRFYGTHLPQLGFQTFTLFVK